MRLFVAISPPPAALAELEAAVARFRPERPELRWTRRGGWHLTLAFLGEVAEDRVADLSRRLARAAGRSQPVRLSIRAAGAFPAPGRARVLWAGIEIEGEQRALQELAWSVAAAARRAGAPPPDEGRRYRPHLTLARCREPADVTALAAELGSFRGCSWQASQIDLIRSYPGPSPRYEAVGSWPLGRPTSAR
jgi:RNA 2',3'-cyclic 3'-phosphodiesterase